jgi:hypothetical protein
VSLFARLDAIPAQTGDAISPIINIAVDELLSDVGKERVFDEPKSAHALSSTFDDDVVASDGQSEQYINQEYLPYTISWCFACRSYTRLSGYCRRC